MAVLSAPQAFAAADPPPSATTQGRSLRSAKTARPAGHRNALAARHAGSTSAAAIAAVAGEEAAQPIAARPAPSCGGMLMPAAALKQVSRGFSSYHAGVDLMAPYGSPIRAAAAGRVVFAGWYFGYGNMIDIQSQDGTVTRYGHLSAFAPETRPGHPVAVGETIGQIGTSGHAHGPHVHFEVRIGGRAVDPKPYLALSGCTTDPGVAIEEAHAPDAVPGRQVVTDARPGGVFQ